MPRGIQTRANGDIIKAHVQKGAMKGDDFANFVCKWTTRQGTDVLGGGPASEMLKLLGIWTLEYDMAGRAGRAADPSKGHFVPWLKPSLAQCGVKGLFLHPKGGMSDPIELVNYLVQREVAKWESGEIDSFSRNLCGPQRYAAKWQPKAYDPGALTVADRLEIYVEISAKGKADFCHWMPASIEATRVVKGRGKQGGHHEFSLEYADTAKAWTRLAAKDFGKGRKNAPGWRLDPDFYTTSTEGKIELKRVQAPAQKSKAKLKSRVPAPVPKTKAKVKHGAPASSSSSDNNGYVSGSGDGLSSSSDDAPTGNSDIDTLSKRQRKSLLLEQNGDTDPSGSSDDPEAPGAGTDTSDQAGGSKHGNAPPLVDREANIREMAGLMALNCYNMVAMAPTTSAKRRRTGELHVQKPKSSKYAAERGESLDAVAGARKRWFERVRDNLCATHGSRECKKQRCTGCAFVNLCTSHCGEDDWVEVTEWLLAMAAATGKAAHIIVNRGRRVQLMSVSAGGEQMSTRELHAANWPDPTEELTVVWNGSNHFNGVVPEGWRKPEVEPTMGAGDASTVLGAWLREFRCQLWESTPYGFCGLESAAMSLRFLRLH